MMMFNKQTMVDKNQYQPTSNLHITIWVGYVLHGKNKIR